MSKKHKREPRQAAATKKPVADWLEGYGLERSLSILDDLATRHALNGGALGQRIAGLIASSNYVDLLKMDVPVRQYDQNVQHLIECRQALAFYKKFEPLPVEPEKEAVAYNAFLLSELKCQVTNDFFRALARGNVNLIPRLAIAFYDAKRKIARVLGPCPKISDLKLMFGPGSTTSIKRTNANPQSKLGEKPQCSELLFHSGLLPSLMREMPHWLDCHAEFTYETEDVKVQHVGVLISHAALQFVPKNAKTYRAIDVQPTLNTLLQGGIGRWMTRRLKLAGIDITDQSKNQRMACEGSITNALATLDLQSASDSVSLELVRFLLDEDWFALLRAASSGVTIYRDNHITLEKFTSMGNGYTFPLETVIFWALTAAACSGAVDCISAYGDDIICPAHRAPAVIEVLEAAGFTINREKSYLEGPFRESCGADFYLGIDTRPYFQKSEVTCETLFTLHNFYMRSFNPDMAEVVLSYIPSDLRLFGPDGYGDGHLIRKDWTGYRTRVARRRGFGGVFFDTYQRTPRKIANLWPGDYVTPLYSIYARERESHRTVESEHQRYEHADYGDSSLYLEYGWLQYCYKWSPMPEQEYLKNHRPLWPVPDADEYRKVSIYTFAR